MLNEAEVLSKIKSRDIFDGTKFRNDLLDDLGATQNSWAERNTKEYDSRLWRKMHVLALPPADLQQFFQLTYPLERPYSWNDAAVWLTTTDGLDQIRKLAAKNNLEVLEKSPCNPPNKIIDCLPYHQSVEVYFHYSFTGNDMGDGNGPTYIRLITLDQPLWATPFTIIEKKKIQKTSDAIERYYEYQWTQAEELIERTTYTSKLHYFCQEHYAKAQMQVAKYYRDLYPKVKGSKKNSYHYQTEFLEECLSHKIKVIPRDQPVKVYDCHSLSWHSA